MIETMCVKQKNVRRLVSSIFGILFVEMVIDQVFEMFCYQIVSYFYAFFCQ
jgi:hypothetical protein